MGIRVLEDNVLFTWMSMSMSQHSAPHIVSQWVRPLYITRCLAWDLLSLIEREHWSLIRLHITRCTDKISQYHHLPPLSLDQATMIQMIHAAGNYPRRLENTTLHWQWNVKFLENVWNWNVNWTGTRRNSYKIQWDYLLMEISSQPPPDLPTAEVILDPEPVLERKQQGPQHVYQDIAEQLLLCSRPEAIHI